MRSDLSSSIFPDIISNPDSDESIEDLSEVLYQTYHYCYPIRT